MTSDTQPLSENQALVRLILFISAILLIGWVYDNHTPEKNTSNTPAASASQSDLKVEPPLGSGTTTTNPQSTAASPVDNSPRSVQSGQSDLQQAQNSSQLPEAIKEELGL